MMKTKKRFVLFVQQESERDREIALEGREYPDLRQASESIYGQYSYNSAVEIFGRDVEMGPSRKARCFSGKVFYSSFAIHQHFSLSNSLLIYCFIISSQSPIAAWSIAWHCSSVISDLSPNGSK